MFSVLFFLFSLKTNAYESMVVGEAAKTVLTSRIVTAHVIFAALYQTNDKANYFLPLKGKALISATSNQIMEYLIAEEATSFSLAEINNQQVARSVTGFKNRIAKRKDLNVLWNQLEISDAELKQIAYTKLRADAFLKLKTETFSVRVSNEELAAEIRRRTKDKSADLAKKIEEQVKKDLEIRKLQSAIREWFQILRSKYVAKNLLIKS